MNTKLKFNRVRAGWYETGNDIEGAYVISSDSPRSWEISQWTMTEFGTLELMFVDAAGSFTDAKQLAQFDCDLTNTHNTQTKESNQ
jgi:hypothetical protein